MHNFYDFSKRKQTATTTTTTESFDEMSKSCVLRIQTNNSYDVYYVMKHASYRTSINETTAAAAAVAAYIRRSTWRNTHVRSIQF